MEYPEWLDKELWKEFKRMRVKIKKPMTEYAEKIGIEKLNRFIQSGCDQNDVINNSIFNCYQGLFEVKNEKNKSFNGSRNEKFTDKLKSIGAADIRKRGLTGPLD